jgi:hypothetical protein
MKRRARGPVLITDAERSQEDQLRTRQTRYVVMMSIRVVCLVAGAILVSARPPLLGLWLTLCAAGMIVIPWVAVVLANDRLPKERHRWRRHRQPNRVSSALGGVEHVDRVLEVDGRSPDGGDRRG